MIPFGEQLPVRYPDRERDRHKQALQKLPLPDMIRLAESSAQGNLPAYPGKEWGLHYPKGGAVRAQLIDGLLAGTVSAQVAAAELQPVGLVYDVNDFQEKGVPAVIDRIRAVGLYHKNFDYGRFAQFVSSLKGKNISAAEAQGLYEQVVQGRLEYQNYDISGTAEQRNIFDWVSHSVESAREKWVQLPPTSRVLTALQQDWWELKRQLPLAGGVELTKSLLSPEELALFNKLQSSYRDYMQFGNQAAYNKLAQEIVNGLPSKTDTPPQPSQADQEIKDLLEELKKDQPDKLEPGSQGDPGIPQSDQDEYHPPPLPSESGQQEKGSQRQVYYEIKPPLGGYYISGRKSYYDQVNKVWSKRKQLSHYNESHYETENRHSITCRLDSGVKSLPIPNTFALDSSSLRTHNGAVVTVFRDQNGCFYVQADRNCTFSIDFVKSSKPFNEKTIAEDTEQLYSGHLSTDTETFLRLAQGSPRSLAKQAQSYVFTHHHYPGGGDLQAAQAVQYKLQQSSTPDTYIQNLDASEYLECYSANTLFCALVRKLGVPARLVVGHRVSGARKGVSEIDSTTGHAWSEIWDGTQWVRFDATPAAKPEDKQKKQEKDQQEDQSQDDSEQESAPDAEDGPADQSPPPQQGSQDNQQNQQQQSQSQDQQSQQQSQDQQQQQNQQQQDSQSMGEASEQSIDEAKQQLDAAKEKFEEMKQQKQELKDKVEQADSFKDIEEIKKELDQAGLLDQMEKDLERQIEAKQEQMKQEMEDKLDKLADDGFLDEKKRDELLDKLKDGDARELDRLEQEVRKEQQLADTYEGYTQLVEPAVEYWWERFVNSLPRQPEMDFDEDALMRQGAFNRRAVQNPRNLIFGTVRNPRLFSEQVKPMFMATVMIDVSGSMSGEKLQQALLLLVFYNQLFSRISKEYGYIRYANYVFSDSLRVIKDFDQDYESSDRYEFYDGKDISGRERKSRTTIKARIMNAVKADGGTNMLGAVEHVATQLNAQKQEFPDYTSAFYFMGDGEDTCGNSGRVRQFLQAKDADPGFGDHLVSAIVLGGQLEFQQLSAIFGPESTAVARTFDELVEKAMENFERDITNYVSSLTRAF